MAKQLILPSSYIRPEFDSIPIVDLSCQDRTQIIKQIDHACVNYGFFQVINHGISKETMEKVIGVAHEYFNLLVEEEMKLYSDDPSKTTSFNVKKKSINRRRHYLRCHRHPLDKYMHEWPSVPSSFKEIMSGYTEDVLALGLRLEEMISESLGLEKEWLKNALGEQQQHMSMNYYPACHQPEITSGVIPSHTDPNALTILLQDVQLEGLWLQVLKDGKWLTLKPEAYAFVVNLGDQLQALSNGKYKSAWHSVTANKPRVSIPCFLTPSKTAIIRAPDPLKTPECPSMYTDFTYAQYYKAFWSRRLGVKKHCLDLFKNKV